MAFSFGQLCVNRAYPYPSFVFDEHHKIIGSIFRKSLRLSGRARLEHSVGQITTMISSDVEKFDLLSYLVH
jgi:hypothetical protein